MSVFMINECHFKHLLLKSTRVPWVGGHRMSCTSFGPGGGREELGESESFVKSLILLVVYWVFCQCLIRPWGRKYLQNKQLVRFPAFFCSWRQLKNITSKKSYLNPFELPLGNFTVANLNLITPSQNNFRKEKGAPVWKYYSFIHTSAKTFISLSPRSKVRLDIVLLKIWNSCDLIFFSSWIFIK